MKNFKQILGIGAVVLGMAGCDYISTSPSVEKERLETVVGEPLSVVVAGDPYRGMSLSVTLKDKNNDLLVGSVASFDTINGAYDRLKFANKYTGAASLLEAEIADGDHEGIELQGVYTGNVFNIAKLQVNGYTFEF